MKDITAFIITVLAIALCVFASACASLEEKSVAVSSQSNALRIETSGSVSSQSIAPNIMIGGGSVAVSTSRSFKKGEHAVPTMAYNRSASFFGSLFGLDIASETFTYTGTVDESAKETSQRLKAFKGFKSRTDSGIRK